MFSAYSKCNVRICYDSLPFLTAQTREGSEDGKPWEVSTTISHFCWSTADMGGSGWFCQDRCADKAGFNNIQPWDEDGKLQQPLIVCVAYVCIHAELFIKWTRLVLTITLGARYHSYFHLTVEEAAEQRGTWLSKVTHLMCCGIKFLVAEPMLLAIRPLSPLSSALNGGPAPFFLTFAIRQNNWIW